MQPNQPRHPEVNLAVCGQFHYCNYVRFLEAAGRLNRFYYAARMGTNGRKLGLPEVKAVNGFVKEYMVHLHARLLGERGKIAVQSFFHDWWQRTVLKHWTPARILHTMLHGNNRFLIERAHREGAVVIGEPVNSHPADLRRLLNEENELLGIPARMKTDLIEQRLGEESLRCDYLLAGSQFVVDSFVRNGFPAARAKVIPYGVDFGSFAPRARAAGPGPGQDLPKATFRVICVAQITPRKGHIYLINAWKQLNLPNAELLFIGRAAENMCPVLAANKAWFKHIPHVPNQALREYYCSADVLVLPSIEDGFAYVCAEAMGCGLPIITTVNTGASELLEEGVDGFKVPIRSAVAIAEKIELLYRNRQLARDMGRAAQFKAASSMGWEQYTDRLTAFYQQIDRDGERPVPA